MAFGNNPVMYADPSGLAMQGYPLAGGYSGNVTTAPTISSGNIAANNLGGGPALSPATNSFLQGAVHQALSPPRSAASPSPPIASPFASYDYDALFGPSASALDPIAQLRRDAALFRQGGRSVAPPNYLVPATGAEALIASNARQGIYVVDEYLLGGVSYGDILVRNDINAYQRDLITTTDPAEAFVGKMISPLASALQYVAGGAIDAIFPRSEPSRHVVFSDGTTATGLSGGPSSGGMWGQGIALATVAGPKVPGMQTAPVPKTTAPSSAPKYASDVRVGGYLAGEAPRTVQPGTRVLTGQYIESSGAAPRVQPWTAHYDKYGRLIGRTDYNAANPAAGIPDIHYHTYQWGPGMNPLETGSHIPGVFRP